MHLDLLYFQSYNLLFINANMPIYAYLPSQSTAQLSVLS